jgi:hypothetical protein
LAGKIQTFAGFLYERDAILLAESRGHGAESKEQWIASLFSNGRDAILLAESRGHRAEGIEQRAESRE